MGMRKERVGKRSWPLVVSLALRHFESCVFSLEHPLQVWLPWGHCGCQLMPLEPNRDAWILRGVLTCIASFCSYPLKHYTEWLHNLAIKHQAQRKANCQRIKANDHPPQSLNVSKFWEIRLVFQKHLNRDHLFFFFNLSGIFFLEFSISFYTRIQLVLVLHM